MDLLKQAKFGADRSRAVGRAAPQNFQHRSFLRGYVWLYVVVYAAHDEIWHGRVHHGPALMCQMWPRSGMAWVQEPPQMKIW